jgi:hypothetical protein
MLRNRATATEFFRQNSVALCVLHLVHLVNGSGHFGVSFYQPVKMADLEIELPSAKPPKSVRSLVSRETYSHDWSSDLLTIQIPQLSLFEAIEVM